MSSDHCEHYGDRNIQFGRQLSVATVGNRKFLVTTVDD
jgi:hypothetical protein